jgi:hypothetical protein
MGKLSEIRIVWTEIVTTISAGASRSLVDVLEESQLWGM